MLKDKKIRILSAQNTAEPGNMPHYEWTPIHTGTLWAYYRQLSGKEYYAAKAVEVEEDALFVVNWRSDITTDMIIEFRGIYYNIVRIDDFEGYKSDIKLYAKTNGSETPPLS